MSPRRLACSSSVFTGPFFASATALASKRGHQAASLTLGRTECRQQGETSQGLHLSSPWPCTQSLPLLDQKHQEMFHHLMLRSCVLLLWECSGLPPAIYIYFFLQVSFYSWAVPPCFPEHSSRAPRCPGDLVLKRPPHLSGDSALPVLQKEAKAMDLTAQKWTVARQCHPAWGPGVSHSDSQAWLYSKARVGGK